MKVQKSQLFIKEKDKLVRVQESKEAFAGVCEEKIKVTARESQNLRYQTQEWEKA